MADDWRRGDYVISTDPSLLDLETVHEFLRRSYWASERPLETLKRAVEGSLNFGLYHGEERRQVGFARVVTDFATFAWLCDVFIDEAHRGQGLGVWLMETVVEHPELRCMRLWMLGTRDAHGLYEKIGFTPLSAPEKWMQKLGC
jgi:GNAT superfamily N-acetyltransferase